MEFKLNSDYIELFKLLKILNLSSSGGEAKQFIATGDVFVNNQVETRKGYKVREGDIIQFNNETISVTK